MEDRLEKMAKKSGYLPCFVLNNGVRIVHVDGAITRIKGTVGCENPVEWPRAHIGPLVR